MIPTKQSAWTQAWAKNPNGERSNGHAGWQSRGYHCSYEREQGWNKSVKNTDRPSSCFIVYMSIFVSFYFKQNFMKQWSRADSCVAIMEDTCSKQCTCMFKKIDGVMGSADVSSGPLPDVFWGCGKTALNEQVPKPRQRYRAKSKPFSDYFDIVFSCFF